MVEHLLELTRPSSTTKERDRERGEKEEKIRKWKGNDCPGLVGQHFGDRETEA